MKDVKITGKIKKRFGRLLDDYPLVRTIAHAIHAKNGRTLLVGGAVRDLLLDLSTKDLDIEIYGLTAEQLELLLHNYGPVSLVGRLFGVFRLHGLNVDWSLPRADSSGRKPQVRIDPFMPFKEAFRRRDLTINAMGIDILSGELIDPFDGRSDLSNKLLRTPDVRFFIQDPLRFFRVMQFISRFEMIPDDRLIDVCKTMDISNISRERIEVEFEKMLLKSRLPSRGIRWIQVIDRLSEVLPELFSTVGVQQNPKWHPEGDVFEHTMQTLDAAAAIVQSYDNRLNKLVLLYAALCHDLGKATTTQKIDEIFKSIGHAKEGAMFARQMLKRITHEKNLIVAVVKLVKYHMAPMQLVATKACFAAYKRLANKLTPQATLRELADLFLADKQGRNPRNALPLTGSESDIAVFIHMADKAQVLAAVEKPLLQGRDLLDVIESGPCMGELLKKAYQMQIEEGIKDKEELKRRVLKNVIIRKKSNQLY